MSRSLSLPFRSLLTSRIGIASLPFLSFASLAWRVLGLTQEDNLMADTQDSER